MAKTSKSEMSAGETAKYYSETPLPERLRQYRKAGIPILMFGPPGMGKSEMVRQAAESDETVIDVRLSMYEPVDLMGLPFKVDGSVGSAVKVGWARPDIIPSEGKGILLLDELNCADPGVMNAALQLLLERQCGPHKLGDGWSIMACANKASHGANVHQLPAPLRNRCLILDLPNPSYKAWMRWAMSNDVHPHVIAYIGWKQSDSVLYSPPPDEHSSFPSPRSWTFVSKLLKSGGADAIGVTGLVGHAAAAEFIAYVEELANIPHIDDLLSGKIAYQSNWKAGVNYAILTHALMKVKGDVKILPQAAKLVNSISKAGSPELAAIFYTGLFHDENKNLMTAALTNKDCRQWIADHNSSLDPSYATKARAALQQQAAAQKQGVTA